MCILSVPAKLALLQPSFYMARRKTMTFCLVPTRLGFEKHLAIPQVFTHENMAFAIAAEIGANLADVSNNN